MAASNQRKPERALLANVDLSLNLLTCATGQLFLPASRIDDRTHLGRGSEERLSDLWAQLAGSVCVLRRRGASRRPSSRVGNVAPLTLYAFRGSIIDITFPPSRFGCTSLFFDARCL
eukprot:tig00000912_g5458.t1